MNLVKLSLGNPVAVIVGIIMALMFGGISLSQLPVQLTPEIEEPQITITTIWRAAAPNEVEAEIIEPQEDVLRGLPGMTKITATAREGRGEITLTFSVDMELNRALIEVLNRLNQVPSYPEDADEPVLATVGGDANAIAYFSIRPVEGNNHPIDGYKDYIEEVVQTRFEQIPGVAKSETIGGRDREIRITFDPYKVASLGIELPIVSRLAGSGEDVSGGATDVGKREYSVRFAGKYTIEDLAELIIEWRDGHPVYLRDVAKVEQRLMDKNSFVLEEGHLAMVISAKRETGVNVLRVMKEIKKAGAELRDGPLARAGLDIRQVYDETIYINQSIRMLANNLSIGIVLAIVILWLFLRRIQATLMVALAIPTCLISSFLVMHLAGRTLNVISLAGLAFAVGMVLDASIVVLENIIRLREQGASPQEASEQGALQVSGALLASTATTVAIFLPIVFLQGEAGQLFSDLAITITAAICLSFLVALMVIPTFSLEYMSRVKFTDAHEQLWRKCSSFIMRMTATPRKRYTWIAALIIIPLIVASVLLPQRDYLPEGSRNLALAVILPAPGTNIGQIEKELGSVIAKRMDPYLNGGKYPEVKHYFFISTDSRVFMGVIAKNPKEIDDLLAEVRIIIKGFPDVIAFANKRSLFTGSGGGRSIDMDLQGKDLTSVMQAAKVAFVEVQKSIPGASVQPVPGLELAQPELRLIPNERRITEAGWNRGIMAGIIRALGDGLYVGDYFDGEKTMDIIVRAEPWATPEELASIPLATPNTGILPLNELVEIRRTAGPDEIRRVNRRRTVTLRITPPVNVSLEESMQILKNTVEAKVRGALPEDGSISYTGSADKLQLALQGMTGSFILAIAILYLLMSALFRSFRDSFLVILALPLATVGGVVALFLINTIPSLFGKAVFQPMDLITMIGFIILLGLVVNNAILLVHQSRAGEREGLSREEAVERAVRQRLRPIIMSTLTSIFGMLPLLLIPGAGTELYRGMAGVIVGGMSVSTIFTLILLPSLLRIGEDKQLQQI
ncbi:MAG: multidrug efflux pump subunit AcrB [Planctomycetota bacterium]